MAEVKIAFDEAGNTGANLLDPEQPVFVLASVNIDEPDAIALVESHKGRASELHFAGLRRSKGGRERILRVLNADILSSEKVRLSRYHKPFYVTTKIVDYLVESMAHEDGVDLYERGANLGLANMWYYVIPTVIGVDRFEQFQDVFVRVFREQTWVAIMRLYRFVGRLYDELDDDHFFKRDLAVLLSAVQRVGWKYYSVWDESHIDPAIPAIVDLGCHWTELLDTEFSILHDQSKPIEKERELLELMMSTDDPTEIIGAGSRTRAFPIRASGLHLVDSASHPQVQIADLLASSVAYASRKAKAGNIDDFSSAIIESNSLSGHLNQIWPEMKVTPEELGTEDVKGSNAVDYTTEYIRKRKEKG